MRKYRTSAAVVILLVLESYYPADGQDRASQPLSLQEVIAMALEQSPRIAAAEQGVQIAREGRAAARRQRLPQVALAAWYEGFPFRDKLVTPRHMDIPPTAGPEMLDSFRRQFVHSVYNFGVTWSLPLFTSGRISSQIEFADLAAEATEFSLHQVQNDLGLALSRTYYRILELQRVTRATAASLEYLRESERIVRQALETGKAAPVDLLRIQARLAEVWQNLIRVRNEEAVVRSSLNVLMGQEDIGREIVLADTLSYEPGAYDLAQSMQIALQQRPEYLRQQGLVEMQQAQVRMARAQYLLPELRLMGGYRGVVSNRDSDPVDDGEIVVRLNIPIVDEVARKQIAQERARLRQAEEKLERLKLEVQLEVHTTYLNLVNAQERLQASRVALEPARESRRIEQLKLAEGKGIITDILETQAAELGAIVNYMEALADYKVAQVALQRATGAFQTGL